MIESTDELLVERVGAVVTVTISRPRVMNAMTSQMFVDFGQICRSVNEDETVRVMVITGAGGNFCSGADVSGQADRVSPDTPVIPLRNMRRIKEAAMALHDVQHPVVAKVRGVAAGAGLNLALGCDLFYASDDARFSEIFSRRGLSLDFGGSWLLPRRIGLHRAKELAFLAEVIDATEADRIGLVNRVLPGSELDTHVDHVVSRIEAGPPLALSMSKALLEDGIASSMAQALESEGLAQSVNFSTSDIREASLAWIHKREAIFKGH